MEQPPNIDQLFRERLHHAEVPPPAFVWPRVAEELRRRRRRFFLWLWLGVGLAGAGVWGLWRVNAGHNSLAEAVKTTHETAVHPTPSNRSITGNTSAAAPLPTLAREKSTSNRSITGNTSAAWVLPNEKAKSQAGTQREASAQVFYPVKKQKQFGRQSALSAAPDPLLLPLLTTKDGSSSVITEISPLAYSAAPLTFLPEIKAGLVLLSPAHSLVLPKAKPFVRKKKQPLKNCYNFAQHPRVWLLDAYAGPSLPQRQLTAMQSESDDYLQQRRNTEKTNWAFHAGVRGSLLFGRHFLLRTGAHYEQMTEVFAYGDPNYIRVLTEQTSHLVDGTWKTVLDTISISYGEHYVKTFNRFGMLEIPLLVGAEFRAGRVGVSVQGGASLNVWFWKRGTILNAGGSPQNFTPGQEDASPVFRHRAGWSATASAQLFYHLRPRLRVFAEPYDSHAFRPLTLASQPVAQHYTIWGLKLGLTKIFD